MSRAFLLIICLWQSVLGLTQLPPDFNDEVVAGPWPQPIKITFDDQGRGYVCEATGIVHLIDTAGIVLPDPFLDLREEVARWIDHGMVGFALDPQFAENGYVYVLYPVDRHYLDYYGTPEYNPNTTVTHQATIGRLTRFTADANNDFKTILPESRKVLIGETIEDGFPIYFDSHGLGDLVFAQDGTLLISCGDAASSNSHDSGSNGDTYWQQALNDGIIRPEENVGAFKAQQIDNPNGKILRIDPATGAGLPSNPFYDPDRPFAAQSRVWSLGFRNPYRFILVPNSGSHQPEDGQPGSLLVGDVGLNSWEEIDLVTAGGQNFGWPIYEGFDLETGYASLTIQNPDAPNPLNGVNGCNQPYFQFRQLLFPDALDSLAAVNPCDPNRSIEAPYFRHRRAAIMYRNFDSQTQSPPYTAFPGYDDSGQPIHLALESDEAPISSPAFQGTASLGGTFYFGHSFPEKYYGKYFHIDYQGWIRVMDYDAIAETFRNVEDFHLDCPKITDLAVNPRDGNLYYLTVGEKKLRRISFGGNPAPVPVIKVDQQFGPSPLTVQFDATASTDDAGGLSFHWDFGDGQSSNDATPQYTFQASTPQPFPVHLTVTDSLGASKTASILISINNTPPEVTLTSPLTEWRYPLDATTLLRLSAAVHDQESPNEDLTFEWSTTLYHNEHFHPTSAVEMAESFALISPLGCEDEPYWYGITLKVSDPHGLSSEVQQFLYPNCEGVPTNRPHLVALSEADFIDLKWETQDDFWKQFVVERSSDFFHFTPIGTVDFEFGKTGYQFQDLHPLQGTNIYRLQLLGAEGAFHFSNLAMADYPLPMNHRIFPNPVQGQLHIEVAQARSTQLVLQLFNALGQQLQQYSFNTDRGAPFSTFLEVSQYPTGSYFYLLKNGAQTVGGQFIKH